MPTFSFVGFLAAFLDLLEHPLAFVALLCAAIVVGMVLVTKAEAARQDARDQLQTAYLRAQREQAARARRGADDAA